ncbi:MAG TPA: sigma 54-interacting transcriptional regulator [Thermoanaerobaculia bacterium]
MHLSADRNTCPEEGVTILPTLAELLFSQSLDGIFFMMLDEPVRWDASVDKEAVLDHVFEHQRVTRANDAMLAQYGAEREVFLGLSPKDLFAHDLERGRRGWREMFDRGRIRAETEERMLDGRTIWIEGDYICLYDEEGRIRGHFGIQRDITERRRHEEMLERRVDERTAELKSIASRLRAIASALSDLVMVVDGEGRYLELLTGQQELLYRPAEELKGKRFDEIFPADLAAEFMAVLRRTIATGETQVHEYMLTVPAGERWFEGRSSPLDVDSDGRRCVVFIARDITERKRAEELERQNVYLREELATGLHQGEMIGRSAAMQRIFHNIELVASTGSTVLLLGETGTGKELIARAIHQGSARADAVLIKVNCGALPSGLVESELFGHERGAFTGATQQKKGRFELAHRGTIFLDEVGELPLDTQVKLLRVLQEQEIERIGGTRTIRIDVRVIAATNRDLQKEIEAGRFRADLYYRLNVFPILVPPLRDRKEDIPLLASHFVRDFAKLAGREIDEIENRALVRLLEYDWPGNVRELANVLERAVILCRGLVLRAEHVGTLSNANAPSGSFETLVEMERIHILRALERTGGLVSGPHGAAEILGLKRSTLWSRMQRLGIRGSDR